MTRLKPFDTNIFRDNCCQQSDRFNKRGEIHIDCCVAFASICSLALIYSNNLSVQPTFQQFECFIGFSSPSNKNGNSLKCIKAFTKSHTHLHSQSLFIPIQLINLNKMCMGVLVNGECKVFSEFLFVVETLFGWKAFQRFKIQCIDACVTCCIARP